MIKVAFFDAKAYDKPSFEHYGSEHDMQFRFLETKLNEDTVELARGCDAVCVFVNDTVNAAAIDKLYAMGVKLIALRSAGYNNVDVQAAFGKIHVVHVPAYSPYASCCGNPVQKSRYKCRPARWTVAPDNSAR